VSLVLGFLRALVRRQAVSNAKHVWGRWHFAQA
jgi:hypothetical protein